MHIWPSRIQSTCHHVSSRGTSLTTVRSLRLSRLSECTLYGIVTLIGTMLSLLLRMEWMRRPSTIAASLSAREVSKWLLVSATAREDSSGGDQRSVVSCR